MEAIFIFLDMLLMLYLVWRVFRTKPSSTDFLDLGLFHYSGNDAER